MGRSGRHRHTDPTRKLRTILIAAAGIATAGITAVALGVVLAGVIGSSSSAASASRATAAYPPRARDRVSRGAPRTPLPAPTVDPEASAAPPPQQTQPALKKKHRPKILSRGACEASYYGSGGHTASGEAFDPDALTAAHRTLPIGSKVRVTNRHNDRSVTVRINDRGPFVAGRCLDLSSAAMQAVGGLGSGVIPVRYEVLARI